MSPLAPLDSQKTNIFLLNLCKILHCLASLCLFPIGGVVVGRQSCQSDGDGHKFVDWRFLRLVLIYFYEYWNVWGIRCISMKREHKFIQRMKGWKKRFSIIRLLTYLRDKELDKKGFGHGFRNSHSGFYDAFEVLRFVRWHCSLPFMCEFSLWQSAGLPVDHLPESMRRLLLLPSPESPRLRAFSLTVMHQETTKATY